MSVRQAVVAAVAVVVVGAGGGTAVARARHDQPPPSPSSAKPATSKPATSKPATSKPVDQLSEENLVRERLYYDVTGHSFSRVPVINDPHEPLGPCTGTTAFSDVLPKRGLSQRETILAGSDVTRVTELVAQTRSTRLARGAADHIVALVDECSGIQGGDFGYGDPVTVQADANRTVVYFPGYDSDRRYGGYVVFSVGTRVGVINVADQVGPRKVAHLAQEAAGIAAG